MKPTTHREREVKLAAPPGFRLPELNGVIAGVTSQPLEPRRLVTVYWDSSDLRLIRWGCSLRHRAGEGWTVKLPAPAEGVLVVRDEHSFAGDAARPPAAALDLVSGYLRGQPVARLVRMVTLRRPAQLCSAEGLPLAEVDDDEVSVHAGRRLAARFREVEVELAAAGTESLMHAVVARLQAGGAGAFDTTPKLVRALGERARAPADVMAPALHGHSSAADAVARAVAISVIRLLRHDPGVRLGGDPEDVHQARVATRRLRSDLRTFSPILESELVASVREELRWLGGELGAVRDAEVLGARLRRGITRLPEQDRGAAGTVLAPLEVDEAGLRRRLLEALRSERYLRLLDRLVALAQAPPVTSLEPAASVMPMLVAPVWSRLRRDARRLDRDSPDEQLHALRIRAKRCRYAAEAAAPVVGRQAARLAARVADLQEVLGDHHDAVIAAAWLREHGGSGPDAYVTGELSGVQLAEAAQRRDEWPPVWRRASRPRLRSWF